MSYLRFLGVIHLSSIGILVKGRLMVPRRKRSEKRAVRVLPAPVEVVVRPTEEVLAALCPVCGRTVKDRALKIGYVTVGKVGYFDSIDWDADKPFGVAYQATGRGSFQNWRHINPDEAPELFEALKARFIQALREWEAKGWLAKEDILE